MLWLFCTFFPALVYCVQKNLATLAAFTKSSPLVSKLAMQPWKPDLDKSGLGRTSYIVWRTPPRIDFVKLDFGRKAFGQIFIKEQMCV
jgi:hypothetical protein